jgi:hypothetical protein
MSPCLVADWQLFSVLVVLPFSSLRIQQILCRNSGAVSGALLSGVVLSGCLLRLHFATVFKSGFRIANAGT